MDLSRTGAGWCHRVAGPFWASAPSRRGEALACTLNSTFATIAVASLLVSHPFGAPLSGWGLGPCTCLHLCLTPLGHPFWVWVRPMHMVTLLLGRVMHISLSGWPCLPAPTPNERPPGSGRELGCGLGPCVLSHTAAVGYRIPCPRGTLGAVGCLLRFIWAVTTSRTSGWPTVI